MKNAQEAHEAIRPAGETFATPDAVRRELDGDEFRLYELVWQRTVASQMADARGTTLSLRIQGAAGRPAGGVLRERTHPDVRGLPQGVRGDGGRAGRRRGRRRRAPVAQPDPGSAAGRHRAEPGRSLHQPAGPLHRSVVDQGARGAGHRASVNVFVDYQDHPGPRLCAQEGQRPGAVLGRVRRNRFAGTAFRPAGRLRLHRGDGRRAGRDRIGQRATHQLAQQLLLRRRPRRGRFGGPLRRPEEACRHQPRRY